MKRRILLLLTLMTLSLPVTAAPLRLDLLTYEGIEYTCHIKNGQVWYDFAGKRLGERALKSQEIRDLESALRLQRFADLPPEMVKATCDSSDTLTVWQGQKSRSVRATTMYGGPLRAHFQRFQNILKMIRRIAPIPSAQIQRLQNQATP